MRVSDRDAQESLAVIEDVMTRCRRSIAAGGAPYLIVWGAVWIAGFLSVHLLGSRGGYVFYGLDVVGIIASVYLGVTWKRRAPVSSPADRKMLWRIMGFWIAVFAFIWISLAVMGPADWLRISAYATLAIMFAYVVLGLWIDALYLTWVGLGVSVMTLLGFYLLPGWFMLWMALFGGGTMLATGFYIRRYWR